MEKGTKLYYSARRKAYNVTECAKRHRFSEFQGIKSEQKQLDIFATLFNIELADVQSHQKMPAVFSVHDQKV